MPAACSARAAAQPTGPAPRISTSTPGAGIAHQRLDVVDGLGRFGGEDFAAARSHDDVVLDAHAGVVQGPGYVVGGADVEARLDGECHAGREVAPLAGALVVAGVVHVEAEPVARAVHVEALVGFLLERLVERAGEELELQHAL